MGSRDLNPAQLEGKRECNLLCHAAQFHFGFDFRRLGIISVTATVLNWSSSRWIFLTKHKIPFNVGWAETFVVDLLQLEHKKNDRKWIHPLCWQIFCYFFPNSALISAADGAARIFLPPYTAAPGIVPTSRRVELHQTLTFRCQPRRQSITDFVWAPALF